MTEFIRCPNCKARTWEDLHALENEIPTRFRCERCKKIISLGKCAKCGAKSWKRLPDIVQKEGKKPVIRYQCEQCKREIGIVLY